MLLIGLTGGIGSGKSAVAARLASRGATVVDADAVAREVVQPGTPGLAAVVEAFDESIRTPVGALDRVALGRIAFADEAARQRLGTITHPLIAQRSAELVAAAEAAGAQVLVHDVPLLVENHLQGAYDVVVVVEAPLDLRLQRLAARGMAEGDALARIASQASDEQRRAVATYVVDNSGTEAGLDRRVDLLWNAFTVGHDPASAALPVSKNQIRKAGLRLASDQAVTGDHELLRSVVVAHQQPLQAALARAAAVGAGAPAARLKTQDTLLEKLRREAGDLSSVQDVAGVRLVVQGGRDEQDRVVTLLTAAFGRGATRVKDRRLVPSHGYRAVHLVARVRGLPVEVQVRTAPQHSWAQLLEALADRWGRQVRYGAPPDDPDTQGAPGRTRAETVAEVRVWADVIDLIEQQGRGSSTSASLGQLTHAMALVARVVGSRT